ncbi:nuclear distribution protein nudE-like 1-B isoform X2 [Aethina tumida]|uniref:nuclear distribution protein nudE-like 1-B isoform X2 n=1 Tax=Aethina tumida TaxID=116153 RepID=UPI0021498063|nr:nuclear distribution protein nudE-like 1-B isoform X2 [Aethina tumida]
MNRGDQPSFECKDDEIQYWKNLAERYYEDLERLTKESDEFIGESQQLEKEYEATIDQNEKKIKELTIANNRMQNELDACRLKLDQSNKEITNLEKEISTLKSEKTQMTQYIRDLEQKNDDLERSRRIIEESIAGIESAFNTAIERNAILESEVDEKETLKEKLQRLLDERRELQEELMVKEKCPDNERIMNGYKTPPVVDSNRLKENETQTTPVKHEFQTPISPASRVMALNLVSDLIRKVGDLERRLEKNKYDYSRDISTNDLRRSRHSTKNSPAASLHGFSK